MTTKFILLSLLMLNLSPVVHAMIQNNAHQDNQPYSYSYKAPINDAVLDQIMTELNSSEQNVLEKAVAAMAELSFREKEMRRYGKENEGDTKGIDLGKFDHLISQGKTIIQKNKDLLKKTYGSDNGKEFFDNLANIDRGYTKDAYDKHLENLAKDVIPDPEPKESNLVEEVKQILESENFAVSEALMNRLYYINKRLQEREDALRIDSEKAAQKNRAEIQRHLQTIGELKIKVAELERAITLNQEKITSQETDKEGLRNQIFNETQKFLKASQRLNELEAASSKDKAQIQTLEKEIESAKAHIGALENLQQEHDSEIDMLTSERDDLIKQIANLEDQANDVSQLVVTNYIKGPYLGKEVPFDVKDVAQQMVSDLENKTVDALNKLLEKIKSEPLGEEEELKNQAAMIKVINKIVESKEKNEGEPVEG